MALTDEQVERYARHLILKGVGVKGQKRLLASSVLIIGAGGLGSPAALYLAAAGVGHIGLVDGDVVDMSNLQRQIIHTTARVGAPKVESAATAIRALNPDVTVDTYYELVDASNIAGLIEPYDLVIDATDNFAAKFLINDACVLAGKPYIHAGVVGFSGQVMTVIPGEGPCYRCIFREYARGRRGAQLQGGRRARRSGRSDRQHASGGGGEADTRRRQAADRPSDDVRRAGDDVPCRAVAGARTRLPGVRRASDHNHAGSGAIHPAGVRRVNDGDSAV